MRLLPFKNKHAFLDPSGWSFFPRPALREASRITRSTALARPFFLRGRLQVLDLSFMTLQEPSRFLLATNITCQVRALRTPYPVGSASQIQNQAKTVPSVDSSTRQRPLLRIP